MRILTQGLIYLTAITTAACGGSGGSSSTPATALQPDPPIAADVSYNGPGSSWTFDLNADGTFQIERSDRIGAPTELTVTGDYVTTDLGFVYMTISEATGPDAPEPGDEIWALEVPGYALFLPIGDDDTVFVPMVVSGDCPTADLDRNWLIVKTRDGADASDADQDYFGTFNFDVASAEASLPSKYALQDYTAIADTGTPLGGGTCSNGLMNVDDADMYLTESGGALVHTNISSDTESNIIFAMPQHQLSAMSELDGDFAALYFLTDGTVVPATLTCASGLCDGALIDDVQAATEIEDLVLNLTGTMNQPELGFISGQLTQGVNTSDGICMVNPDIEPTLVSCIAQAPEDATQHVNLLLVQQES